MYNIYILKWSIGAEYFDILNVCMQTLCPNDLHLLRGLLLVFVIILILLTNVVMDIAVASHSLPMIYQPHQTAQNE